MSVLYCLKILAHNWSFWISNAILQFSHFFSGGIHVQEVLSCLPVFNKCFCFLFIFRMVSSYLVHHGYCATAEAFARSTDQTVLEELASIKNRQSKAGKHITSFFPPSPLIRYCIKHSLKLPCRILFQHYFVVQFFAFI